ncbi:hypothetical protein Bhyg_07755, partial [Pseudolycoriella hygida]
MNKLENVLDSKQTLITNFYELTSGAAVLMSKLSNENRYWRQLLQNFRMNGDSTRTDTQNASEFLTRIWEVVDKKKATKHGHIDKYDEKLKHFCTYLYVIAGKLTYETLSANLHLPSVATVKKAIQSSNHCIIEGSVRVKEMKNFLVKWKLPLQVWMSEDATKIVNKIQYDESTDQIVGLVLPMDSDGMPIQFSFTAENVAKMLNSLLNNPKSDYVYTVMSRALDIQAPSFCLQLFGTDNKYTTGHVLKRWTRTEKMLQSEDVTVLGWSSDADTRCLRAMLIRTELPSNSLNVPEKWREWFNASYKPSTIYVQDHHHIVNKLKTRLYDSTAIIAIGNYVATKIHLMILVNTTSKDKHLFVPSDLSPQDKMDFKPVLKIMNPLVRSCLKDCVHASRGTSIYISLMENIFRSYLDESLTPLERVYHLWYTIFFLRIWRLWLVEHEKFSLKNFITYNSYACIELNGHSLINTIIRLKAAGQDEQFVTVLMGSQTCEEFFRSLRSLTSTYWTSINFTLLEMLYKLPTVEEIYSSVNKAKSDALKDTTEIGIQMKRPQRKKKAVQIAVGKSIFACRLSSIRLKPEERVDIDADDEFFEDEYD